MHPMALPSGERIGVMDEVAQKLSTSAMRFMPVNPAFVDAKNALLRLQPAKDHVVPWRDETIAWIRFDSNGARDQSDEARVVYRFGPGQDPRGIWSGSNLLIFYSRTMHANKLTGTRPSTIRVAMRNLSQPEREVQLRAPRNASPFTKFFDWEKNWTPFEHEDAVYLSYRLEPHIVVSCSWFNGMCAVVHRTTAPAIWSYYNTSVRMGARGGSPPLLLPERDSYVGIAHFRGSQYTHVFYEFDSKPPFAMRRASKRFRFTGPDRIQFVAGMYRAGSDFVISYGAADAHSMLTRVPVKMALQMLDWREAGGSSDSLASTLIYAS